MTAIYQTTGTLTHAIPAEHIAKAQAYLTEDDMTQYLDDPISEAIARVQWDLKNDGYHYSVEAITHRELSDDELKQLSSWVSGQNSDGLGEGFEQQNFAWLEDDGEEEDCGSCLGTGLEDDDDGEEVYCSECDGAGYLAMESDGHMCSFDWETNDSVFTRVG